MIISLIGSIGRLLSVRFVLYFIPPVLVLYSSQERRCHWIDSWDFYLSVRVYISLLFMIIGLTSFFYNFSFYLFLYISWLLILPFLFLFKFPFSSITVTKDLKYSAYFICFPSSLTIYHVFVLFVFCSYHCSRFFLCWFSSILPLELWDYLINSSPNRLSKPSSTNISCISCVYLIC